MAQPSAEKTPSIYLYIPNIIGYFRIIINFIAFAVCYSNRPLFAILYFFRRVSYIYLQITCVHYLMQLVYLYYSKILEKISAFSVMAWMVGSHGNLIKVSIHITSVFKSCSLSFCREGISSAFSPYVETYFISYFNELLKKLLLRYWSQLNLFMACLDEVFFGILIYFPIYKMLGKFFKLSDQFISFYELASTFGAVLDMVTDRVSTACLLALLSQLYRPGLVFLMLLGLDITSHWFQMYSSFLSGKTSHKDVKDTGNWLLKLYYGYRPFMAFCCVASEVLYIILFLFADEKSASLLNVCRSILNRSPLIAFVFISTLVGWALKQVINVIQMKTAADACVVFDLKRGK